MHAIDTNVLVRLLTNDDAVQVKRVVVLFKKEAVYIPKTVLLETEWVLRRLYRLESRVVVSAMRKVCGLENVSIEQPLAVVKALQWCEDGLDFADALHLASSQSCQKFATFDERMKKAAPKEVKQMISLL